MESGQNNNSSTNFIGFVASFSCLFLIIVGGGIHIKARLERRSAARGTSLNASATPVNVTDKPAFWDVDIRQEAKRVMDGWEGLVPLALSSDYPAPPSWDREDANNVRSSMRASTDSSASTSSLPTSSRTSHHLDDQADYAEPCALQVAFVILMPTRAQRMEASEEQEDSREWQFGVKEVRFDL